MINSIIFLSLMFFSSIVFAAPETYWSSAYDRFTIYRSTPDSACSSNFANYKIINPSTTRQYSGIRANGTGIYDCMVTTPTNSTPTYANFNTRLQTCAVATPFFDPKQNICVGSIEPPPPSCDVPAGSKMTWNQKEGSSSLDGDTPDNLAPFPKSSDKCYFDGLPELNGCYNYVANGRKNYACTYTATSNGKVVASGQGPEIAPPRESANQDDTMPPKQAPDDKTCPRGTVNAGLSASGIPMCIGQGTDPKNKPVAPPKVEVEKNEPTEDGGNKNTKTETVKNTDGSTTTKTTVTITRPNGQKETNQEKVTTKTPSGAAGKETVDPKDEQPDLCKQNPNLAVCKNSTVSGKCGDISCAGDAIQCATLRAAAAMQCQQDKDIDSLSKSPTTSLGNSILAGADPMKADIQSALNGTEVDLSNTKFDEAGFLGGGRCLAPVSMGILGRSVTMNFDSICEQIEPLRYLILALAYISAYLIVARSVIGGE